MRGNDNKLWEFLADLAENYIKEKERVSDLRGVYFDLMSNNRWANQDFSNLIDAILVSIDNIEDEFKRPGDRDEDWLLDGVSVMVDGHFANSVLSNRRIADELSDQEFEGMQKAVDLFKRLSGRGRGERGFRGGRDDRSRDIRGGRSTGRDLGRPATASPRGGRSTSTSAVDNHWAAVIDHGADAEPVSERREPRHVEPEPVVAQRHVEPVREEIHVEGPDFTKARPYDRFHRDGEFWELARLSELKLTDSKDWAGDGPFRMPIPTLYDCNEFIKYYVMDNEGNVREEFVPVNDQNRYAAHETMNRSEDQPVAPKPASAGFSRASLTGRSDDGISQQYVPPSRIKLVELIEEIKDDQLALGDAASGDRITSAIFASRAKLRSSGDNARIDLHLLRTPIVASSFEQIELIEAVYNTSSLAGAQQMLNELKPKFDLPVWETLNKRYTEYLLRALKFQFQYDDVLKFNFAKHYDKLLDSMGRTRGSEFVAQFAERIGYVTDLACGHFCKEDVADYTADLYEPIEGAEVPVVMFVDFISISAFNCTLDQLGIGNQLESSGLGLVVNQAQHRELNSALRKLYTNLDKVLVAPAKIRVYLSTSDNRLVEVLPYANKTDTFILAAV